MAGQNVDLAHVGSTVCDEDGRYRFEVVELPTPYSLEVKHGDATLTRSATAGADDVDFVLPDLGTLCLRALDAASGLPIPFFDVWWRPAGEGLFRPDDLDVDMPDPEGWRENRLPSGPLDLLFRGDELGRSTQSARV